MSKPTLDDYMRFIFTEFEQFEQNPGPYWKKGSYVKADEKSLLVFFMTMQFRRIYQFKTQHRWLVDHPQQQSQMKLQQVPGRTTLSGRYKDLYETIQAFMAFLGQRALEIDVTFDNQHLYEDKSLFKALGPVWHQKDRRAGRIPNRLRHLDIDATWSKSGYHGWVYGYGLHLTCNQAVLPLLVQVETGSLSEKHVIDAKETQIIYHFDPQTLSADNSYAQASRIRRWAKQGVVLLSPALKWRNGRYAQAYHRFIRRPYWQQVLRSRGSTIEPLFTLVAQVIGTTGRQKQLPVQGLHNVRTCLALASLSVQIAMLINSLWHLPLRSMSYIHSAFT